MFENYCPRIWVGGWGRGVKGGVLQPDSSNSTAITTTLFGPLKKEP